VPQVFVEIDRAEVSPHLVHSQLYTWNDHFPRDLIANYGRVPGAAPVLRALARRLIVAQLFLHSAHSGRIGLRLAADGRLVAEPAANPDTGARLDAALGVLRRSLSRAGLIALPFARRIGAPGSSFHVGGSLPMSDAPLRGLSDTLGRPGGVGRLHVIDASVFPSVPATTITFSVMANAHRIASEAPED
jgi:choline dehydrogenase-like flavoprotein